MRLISHPSLLHHQTRQHQRRQLLCLRPWSLDLTQNNIRLPRHLSPPRAQIFHFLSVIITLPLAGYQRHDHPINHNLFGSHRAAGAAGERQRSAKKSWTGSGKTAVNTESSEFELAGTAHIVQRIDTSTKFENRD